ncbi:hypothetical protein F2Q70_00007843 [Brassica cretica]|uniref:Uncharacterized protein n=1 Tax=Brassica cretica TaxID=69181 RepID=A0A8S9MBI4_BRACR|nr:hypothetical protein F2Q70_00007843 [Brassica cretica]
MRPDLNFLDVSSLYSSPKVVLSALAWILLNGCTVSLRRISDDLSYGTVKQPKSDAFCSEQVRCNGLPFTYDWVWPIRATQPASSNRNSPSISSVLVPSVCFSFLIGLSSCVAVSTGPKNAIEITLVVLVDEVWTSTSHYVTILQLFDFVVKALPTHSSTVSNSLSSLVEYLSYLAYLCVDWEWGEEPNGWSFVSDSGKGAADEDGRKPSIWDTFVHSRNPKLVFGF